MPVTRNLLLNGVAATVSGLDERDQLLYLLREQCGQRGPKFGCGVAQCGACTILVDGAVTRSCVLPVGNVPEGAEVRTLDGLGTADDPHPMQEAFIEKQAAQCAFCINGMIMGAVGWIEERIASGNTAVPTRTEIADFLSGATAGNPFNYVCRCGAHTRILDAIHAAATEMTS